MSCFLFLELFCSGISGFAFGAVKFRFLRSDKLISRSFVVYVQLFSFPKLFLCQGESFTK